jgi:MFS family permease
MSEPIQHSESSAARSRRYGIYDGAGQAVTQGLGDNYLSAFALLFHASPFQIGLLSALPQIVGTGSQLASIKFIRRLGRRRPLILWGGVGQTLCWLPILLLPVLFPAHGAWLVVTCAVVYFALGHVAVPPWTSVITDLVEPNQRGSYFGRRAQVMAFMSVVALGLGGFLLSMGARWTIPWIGFALLFTLAGLARGLSTNFLARIDDPQPLAAPDGTMTFREFLRQSASLDYRRFLLFSGLLHVCVLIAGPFFVVFMLRDLHWTYFEYGLWMAVGMLGQVLTLHPWGQICDRFGSKKVLTFTGFTVPFLPMIYLFTTSLAALMVVNFVAGVIWGGMALGLQNYVFDVVRPEDKAKGAALANTVNACGWFIGAMVGSWLVTIVPDHLALGPWLLEPPSNLPLVFFVSGLLRILVVAALLGTFREARPVESLSHGAMVRELPLLKPLSSWLLPRETRSRQ